MKLAYTVVCAAFLILFSGCRSVIVRQEKNTMETEKNLAVIPFFPELSLADGGELTESFWSEALTVHPQIIFKSGGRISAAATGLKLCMDRKNLYIGVVCREPLQIVSGGEKPSPWAADNVEFFIGSLNRPQWYCQVVTGANGIRFSRMLDESCWTGAVAVQKTHWSAKIAVPRAVLGSFDGGVVINLLRERKTAGELITYRELAERALEVDRFAGVGAYSSLHREPWTFRIKTDRAGVAWETAAPSPGRIFYRESGTVEWQSIDRTVRKTPYIHSVEISGLKPDTEYEYFVPGMTEYGKFRTLDAKHENFTFAMTSDTHTRTRELAAMLKRADVRAADMFFLLGDQLEASLAPDTHYQAFLNTLTANWKKPFYCVYGNHEGRGAAAESFYDLFCHGRRAGYDAFAHKGVFFVILDTDHDNGIPGEYCQEQFEFLKKTVNSPEFKQAQLRVLISHVPLKFMYGRWGVEQLEMMQKLAPAERDLFDAAFSGHIHWYCRSLPGEKKLFSAKPQLNGNTAVHDFRFPEFTAPEAGLFVVNKEDDVLKLKVFDRFGTLLDERDIRRKSEEYR